MLEAAIQVQERVCRGGIGVVPKTVAKPQVAGVCTAIERLLDCTLLVLGNGSSRTRADHVGSTATVPGQLDGLDVVISQVAVYRFELQHVGHCLKRAYGMEHGEDPNEEDDGHHEEEQHEDDGGTYFNEGDTDGLPEELVQGLQDHDVLVTQ